MRSLPFWIQRADFSFTEHDAVDHNEAVRIVQSHDWAGELAFRSERDSKGEDFCDPGVAFLGELGETLHICFASESRAYFLYHFVERKKVLGLIPVRRFVTRSNIDFPRSEIPDVIYHYFANNHEWLVNRTEGEAA